MTTMSKRERKKKKLKLRVPVAPPTEVHKEKKKYDREDRQNWKKKLKNLRDLYDEDGDPGSTSRHILAGIVLLLSSMWIHGSGYIV